MFRFSSPSRCSAAGLVALCAGAVSLALVSNTAANTIFIPHVLEKSGSVATTPHTFDTEIFLTYTPGLGGTSSGTGATTALYLYDENGQPMTSGTGEPICAPCMYSNGTTVTTPRKTRIRLEDLIMAHGGYGTSSTTKKGFAVLEVTGDPDNLAIDSRVEYSEESPGDISICPKLPRDVLKDWFEPTQARMFGLAHLDDNAGNVETSPNTSDTYIRALYTGGLGDVPAGAGATVELYLYDDSGAPMSGTTGPVCAPCTYALGTGLPSSAPRWLELEVGSLSTLPATKQGFALVRVAGAQPGAVILDASGASSNSIAGHAMYFAYIYWPMPSVAPALATDLPDAPGATLMLRSAPNPAVGAMTFDFELARAANVDLDVFDAAGRRVATVYSGNRPAGRQELRWDRRDDAGTALAAGVYYGRLKANDGSRVTRLVFLP